MAKQVTVTLNGKSRSVVTQEAFEKVWKSRGYSLVEGTPTATPVKTTGDKNKTSS